MQRMLICPNCGEFKKHIAKGLCRKCYSKIPNKRYYQKNKERLIKQNFKNQLKRKRDRVYEICSKYELPLKCMYDGCNISNPLILSVRHVNGRLHGEYSTSKYYTKGSYQTNLSHVELVAEHLFQKNLKNNNYMVFCMNHGRIYEWGTISERLNKPIYTKSARDHKYKIKRYIHRLFLLGRKCAICGEHDYNYLCGHHKNNTGTHDKGLLVMSNERFQHLYKSDMLQCMCFNCHTFFHIQKERKVISLDYSY
ncbi:hypothetical protein [Candidatus Borrarchaeum sp.]|uniref:hypothetical protein n=1 Tax=Candidatus Borrarchaeum sp. TaxID=2846742 RepID=UPI00257DCB9F|nr:hypothetical protein [Candidatus Borrarchaeum sp.]